MFKRLSYITIKGNLGKLLPQMTVLDKDELKFVMNQVNGIRVVIATKWRHTFFYYFTRSRIYRHRDYILLPKSIMEAFSTNSFPTVCEVWMTFLRALEIFWDEVFLLEIQYKTDDLDVRPLSLENEAQFVSIMTIHSTLWLSKHGQKCQHLITSHWSLKSGSRFWCFG